MSRRGVILFGHGSRDPAWREPMDAVAQRIAEKAPGTVVICAFLELQAPDFPAAVAQLASEGAEHVTVAGELTGEVRCRGRLQILPSGRVRARVSTGSLVIQEGAIYEGQLEMAGIERSTLRPVRARSPIASISSDPAERQTGNGTTFIRRLGSPEAPWEFPEGDADSHTADDEPDPGGPAD